MIHVCIEIHVYREARTADALKTGLARAGHDLSTRASASCFGCCDQFVEVHTWKSTAEAAVVKVAAGMPPFHSYLLPTA